MTKPLKQKRKRSSMLRDAMETVREHAMLYREWRAGTLPVSDLSRVSAVLANHRTMLESTQTEERLGSIEARLEELVISENRNVVQFKKA